MITLNIRKTLNFSNGTLPLQINLSLAKGDLLTLYGKSGAGKTSILRMLAGLLTPDEGQIIVDGQTWLDTAEGINLPPQKRSIGFMFQDYALFPNMTIKENLLFALSNKEEIGIVEELIHKIDLKTLQDRKPDTLSGGQKQRVALARALVQKPKLLLLDEPLSALDVEIRMELQNYIQEVHQSYDLTTILVSHDENEIKKMSNRVVVIDDGQMIKTGAPSEVFSKPNTHTLQGKIVNIYKEENKLLIILMIDNQEVTLPVDENEEYYSIGDVIEIDLSNRSKM